MSGGGNQLDPMLLTKEIAEENTEARAVELITARVALEKQLADITEGSRRIAEEQAHVQAETQAMHNR